MLFRVRYGPSYGNGHAADDRGAPFCSSRDSDKFHRQDTACEYTVLPQEMTSSYGHAAGFCRSDATSVVSGRRTADTPADEDEDSCRWYSCSCRRLPSVSTPRPPDTIAYLSGSIDRQPGSWRPLSGPDNNADDADDDAHRHCTCTSGRCRQAPSLSVPRRTCDLDPHRRQQLACYVIASTSDEDADEVSGAATAPPDVQTVAPSVVSAQH